ncbi:hypothetical protein DVH24_017432 [Malus domestica]|uniref:Uncharacterized protein n=1 Tax=Malus domestica TaxID=3750 RepID=A0A498ISZ1_MALDO|nr:hypothetical protein DVH24_017432 [Malus domestica]
MATLSLSSTSQRNFSLYGVSSRSTTTSKFSAFQPRPAKLSCLLLRSLHRNPLRVLLLAKGTAVQKSFLVPLFLLQAPATVVSWIKGEYGIWAAFLALLVRLFFFIPGELELPLTAFLLVIVAPYQVLKLRGRQEGAIISLVIVAYLAFQHFSRIGSLERSFDRAMLGVYGDVIVGGVVDIVGVGGVIVVGDWLAIHQVPPDDGVVVGVVGDDGVVVGVVGDDGVVVGVVGYDGVVVGVVGDVGVVVGVVGLRGGVGGIVVGVVVGDGGDIVGFTNGVGVVVVGLGLTMGISSSWVVYTEDEETICFS